MFDFLVTYAIASAGALTGIAYLAGKEDRNENLEDIQGAGRRHPFVALGVAVCLASLAGLPPASGFLAKFALFTGAFSAGLSKVAIFAFVLSLVAAVYYLRIAFVLFAPRKKQSECKCGCMSSSYAYMLKFMVAVAAIALLALSIVPGFALIG
jgi:NADH-quinone oxidoreductase subunit N